MHEHRLEQVLDGPVGEVLGAAAGEAAQDLIGLGGADEKQTAGLIAALHEGVNGPVVTRDFPSAGMVELAANAPRHTGEMSGPERGRNRVRRLRLVSPGPASAAPGLVADRNSFR
ncbi:hypothetical protein [Streptomyces sp. NPDC048172]|uniref:hypothetical protein n=1 Tax=Streptomyces sp. NPDC048172 TaxID=3365505 RepID=UPI00371D6F76